MKRLEVRCCCQPTKLLGWLQVQDDQVNTVTFQIHGAFGFKAELEELRIGTVSLPIATIRLNAGDDGYRALKAEETPIETLRLIRGFIENHEGRA